MRRLRRKRHRALLQRLVADHRDNLVRYAQSLTRDGALAHDVVQEALLKLWDDDTVSTEEHGRRWLYTTVRRLCMDRRKVERRRSELLTLVPKPGGPVAPDAQLEADETLRRFLVALSTLPPRSEEIVRLRLQAGLSYKEIAAMMELSVSNVGVILNEAKAELRDALGQKRAGASRRAGGAS